MTDIKWGPAIAVDGKRPGWLADGIRIIPTVSGRDNFEPRFAECHGWSYPLAKTTHIRLPADHPHYRQTEAAPIDWSGELEAVHEDGRVTAVERLEGLGDYCVNPHLEGGWFAFNKDGGHQHRSCKWRIRNVPQPTPQADTKPDLTARMEALVRKMADGRSHMTNDCKEARAIVALLPEPVDPDLIEAREIAKGMIYSDDDSVSYERIVRLCEAALKRGREIGCKSVEDSARRALALAGEKEA